MSVDIIRAQLDRPFDKTNYPLLGKKYEGKVRDVYDDGQRLVIITTDRISAFDHLLGTIPFKGEILNGIAVDQFRRIEDLAPHHLISLPDPNVMVVKKLHAIPVEFVVRAYITGSLWRDYLSDRAEAYGLSFPADLARDQRLERPIVTPATKAAVGAHDEPISRAEIVRRGLLSEVDYDRAAELALALFERGRARALDRGLILADTKYEFGFDDQHVLTVIDEIHTPDSSRYWVESEYQSRFENGESQRMLDKENLRQWLMNEHGFSGHGTPPKLGPEIRIRLCQHYMDLWERMLGAPFAPHTGDLSARIEKNLRAAGLLR